MTAKRSNLSTMKTPSRAISQADLDARRAALAAKRGLDIDSLSDEEVQILWDSLSEADRKKYLAPPAEEKPADKTADKTAAKNGKK